MATVTNAQSVTQMRRTLEGNPAGGVVFDWAMIGLSALLAGGLWIDGWAHFHGRTDNTFFTPWHFLFYSAYGLNALFLGITHYRNYGKGYSFRRTLPVGYWLSLVGVFIFGLGGVGDLIWHTLFGIEAGSEALTSPTHLMLAAGMLLVFTGPLRAAWLRFNTGESTTWPVLGPAVLSTTLLVSLLGFFTSYAHPLLLPLATTANPPQSNQTAQAYMMNPDGTLLTRLTNSTLTITDIVPSLDGTRLAYVSADNTDENSPQSAIHVMKADGSGTVKVTYEAGQNTSPSWSNDGLSIIYVHRNGDEAGLYVVNSLGGTPKQIPTGDLKPTYVALSPTGDQLAFTVTGEGETNVYLAAPDGSKLTPYTLPGKSYFVAWSPDSKQLTLSIEHNDTIDVYTMNADGSGLKQLTTNSGHNAFSHFSPDGKNIVFSSQRSGTWELYQMSAQGEAAMGAAVKISQYPEFEAWNPSYALDGSKIYFTAIPRGSNGFDLSPQDVGVAAILLQAVILMGGALFIAWRWSLPFGAFTVLFALNALLMTVLVDTFFLIPAALIAGLVADVLRWRLRASAMNPVGFERLAFIAPMVYYGLYFLTLYFTGGVQWHIHVWAGAIFLAGVVGLLISLLIVHTSSTRKMDDGVGRLAENAPI